MKDSKLKPCPFCGSVARYKVVENSDDEMTLNSGAEYIECEGCGASTNLTFPTMGDVSEIVIEKWNKRIEPDH